MEVATNQSMPIVLCCLCGIEIQQNPSNMCVACIRENIDITEGINKQITIHSCRSCGRFLAPPWQQINLESKELMSLCLRKIPGLSRVKLVDAVWIWTEPHSMRLKVKITIQKEVTNGAILQQAAVIDYTIRNQQCKNCESSYAQGAWHAVVQVRQRVSHKRTFFFLEQLLLKHGAHSDCINIVTFKDGMDFYFAEKNQSLRFIDFLDTNVPTKTKYSRKLISADHSANIGDFKHNFIVEIAPVCKDDLVVLPADLAKNLSNMTRLVIVKRVAAGIHVIDPLSGERNEVNTEKYFRNEFTAVMNSRQLIRYVVLSVDPFLKNIRPSARARGGTDRKTRLAEVVVARESDFAVNDIQFTCITHLGHILKEGDIVLGYDLTGINWNLDEDPVEIFKKSGIPDLILVRKYYLTKGERKWELKYLDIAERAELTRKEQEEQDEDHEAFMQELEGDRELRATINLFKKQKQRGGMPIKKMDFSKGLKSKGKHMDLLGDDNGANPPISASISEIMVLTSEQAANIPAIQLEQNSEFDESNFHPKDFKFI
eukprot:gene9414-12680_t